MKTDEMLAEEFIHSDLETMAQTAEDQGDTRIAQRLRDGIVKRTEVNRRAVAFIDEHGYATTQSLLYLYGKRYGMIGLIIEMGMFVNDFNGVYEICNELAQKSIDMNNIDGAVLWRMFALAVINGGVEPVENNLADKLIRSIYDFARGACLPTQKDWDEAAAHRLLSQTESNAMYERWSEEAEEDG